MVRSASLVRFLRVGALVALVLVPWCVLPAQPAPELAATSILGVQPAMPEPPPQPDGVPVAVQVLGVPAEVRGEVAGVVKIDHVGFDWEALKVLIRHAR